MRFGDAKIGMQGELAGRDIMLDDGGVEQWFEQRGAFGVGNAPGDDPAAENIDDDLEIEVAPLRRPHQLRFVPGPNLSLQNPPGFTEIELTVISVGATMPIRFAQTNWRLRHLQIPTPPVPPPLTHRRERPL